MPDTTTMTPEEYRAFADAKARGKGPVAAQEVPPSERPTDNTKDWPETLRPETVEAEYQREIDQRIMRRVRVEHVTIKFPLRTNEDGSIFDDRGFEIAQASNPARAQRIVHALEFFDEWEQHHGRFEGTASEARAVAGLDSGAGLPEFPQFPELVTWKCETCGLVYETAVGALACCAQEPKARVEEATCTPKTRAEVEMDAAVKKFEDPLRQEIARLEADVRQAVKDRDQDAETIQILEDKIEMLEAKRVRDIAALDKTTGYWQKQAEEARSRAGALQEDLAHWKTAAAPRPGSSPMFEPTQVERNADQQLQRVRVKDQNDAKMVEERLAMLENGQEEHAIALQTSANLLRTMVSVNARLEGLERDSIILRWFLAAVSLTAALSFFR